MSEVRELYERYFKHKLFLKLIVIYSFIAVLSLIALAAFTYLYFARQIANDVTMEQQRSINDMNHYFDQKVETTQAIMQQLYQESALLNDTIYLLEHGYESFIKYRLDSYSESNSTYIRNFHQFYSIQFWKDADMRNITLFSTKQNLSYIYHNGGYSGKLLDWRLGKIENPELIKERFIGMKPIVESEADKPPSYRDLVSVVMQLNNPQTLANVGAIGVDYTFDDLDELVESEDTLTQIAVIDSTGRIVYTSSTWDPSWYHNGSQIFAKMVPNETELIQIPGSGEAHVTVSSSNKLGLTAVALLPARDADARLLGLRNTIIIVTVICIIAVVAVSYISVSQVSRRIQRIIRAMRKVQAGNLNTRVSDEHKDEVGLIADSFNRMVEELKQHIDRVYKSELKQKNAELVALQSQIKPHFLYNTLEVIRMRAVSKGAHDVGEMIYNLASIFKHMVKDKSVIPLEEEIQNCKRYLELTRIRYQDKLQYSVSMDSGIGGYSIMKLSVQPVIENYLIHGLSLERKDNLVKIAAKREGEVLVIEVADNGKGIAADRLKEIQHRLLQSEWNDHGSLGLQNVHNRLRILYGEEAGVSIESIAECGTVVTLRVPLLALQNSSY